MLAPVVVFVYSRPDHTEKLFDSLLNCILAKETDVFIFSDAPRNNKAVDKVKQVRQIIKSEKIRNGFKSVTVIEAEQNKGLANSVIDGVTSVLKNNSKVIVVEDDNLVSIDFLDYMNRALNYYENNLTIGYIGAYTAPISFPDDYKHDVFSMGRGSSYAWATWKKEWETIDWNVSDYSIFKRNRKLRKKFDEYGEDRNIMLDNQMAKKIDSWAIRFAYSMFKNNKLAILPVKTRVQNIGFDGTGVHNVANDSKFDVRIEANLQPVVFENVEVDERIKAAYVRMFKVPFIIKIKRIVKRILDC